MSESVTLKDTGSSYTGKVENAGDLGSPVVVTSGNYTVRFDGNDFATKHLRRIRRNSITQLKSGDIAGKLSEYIDESKVKAKLRFSGNEGATSTLIFLDLSQYCQFGCQVIKFLSSNRGAWQPYPPHGTARWLQKHTTITINKCFASSNDGFGQIKEDVHDPELLQHGIGITFDVTVKQPLNGSGRTVEVCHYARGGVTHEFKSKTLSNGSNKLKSIGQSVVT
jgi:hypothetical protein